MLLHVNFSDITDLGFSVTCVSQNKNKKKILTTSQKVTIAGQSCPEFLLLTSVAELYWLFLFFFLDVASIVSRPTSVTAESCPIESEHSNSQTCIVT